ncbi:hypothetical protein [Paractinoplanes ferrugineus]|uniref:Uncharacterized protein n=1 Tax=Paractinoplanes ferrugineus TaxID=113564 RepID=A0A919MJ57_9ACTN|nr:hypothetical protein [Actinoplanes ferrugineus]GIE16744.1 hypothetical protein Afe05nite_85840 [Actinoplanes ferrugineus]
MQTEDQQQFRISAIVTSGPDLSIQCLRCHRWALHVDRPLTLAELTRHAEVHLEEAH